MAERQSLFPFTLELDEYEAANLEEGLVTLRRLACDTGDWLGQILNRLPKTEYVPNVYSDGQVARALLSKPMQEKTASLTAALEELLSVAERMRGGDPSLDPEAWFAARDYARVVLKKGAA